MKGKPALPVAGKKKVEVKVSIDLLHPDTLTMKITSKYSLYLEWIDPCITYYCLKENQNFLLVRQELEKIWTQKIIFVNTQFNWSFR